MRQALIRGLRVIMPALILPTLLSGIAVAVVGRSSPGHIFRYAAVVALLLCIAITAAGNVPLNRQVATWRLDNPPPDWRATEDRWNRFDTARVWAAVASFGLFVAAMTARTSAM